MLYAYIGISHCEYKILSLGRPPTNASRNILEERKIRGIINTVQTKAQKATFLRKVLKYSGDLLSLDLHLNPPVTSSMIKSLDTTPRLWRICTKSRVLKLNGSTVFEEKETQQHFTI